VFYAFFAVKQSEHLVFLLFAAVSGGQVADLDAGNLEPAKKQLTPARNMDYKEALPAQRNDHCGKQTNKQTNKQKA